MILSRKKGKQFWGGGSSLSNVGGGGGEGAGGASQAWVGQNFVSIEFFTRLIKAYAAGASASDPDVEIVPNDVESTVKNIKMMAGVWTEQYVSALGQGTGGSGSATSLADLVDVQINTSTLAQGQALIYDGNGHWYNGTIQGGGISMTDVWTALAANTNEQINVSHLGNAMSNYVPLAGATMQGALHFPTGYWVVDGVESCDITNKAWDNGTYCSSETGQPIAQLASIRNALRFKWYDTYWNIGNIRGANTNSLGFGIALEDTANNKLIDCFSVTSVGSYVLGHLVIHSGIIGSQHVAIADVATAANTASFVINGASNDWPRLGWHIPGVTYCNLAMDTNGTLHLTSTLSPTSTYHGMVVGGLTSTGDLIANNSISAANNITAGGNLTVTGTGTFGNVYSNGYVTALSDVRLKTVLGHVELTAEKIAAASAIRFAWKDGHDKREHVGGIAQEWQELLPQAVVDVDGRLSMDYSAIAYVSVVSLAKKVVAQQREIDSLAAENAKLEKRLERLEKMFAITGDEED